MPNAFKQMQKLLPPMGAGFYDGTSFIRSITHQYDSNSEIKGGIKEGQSITILRTPRSGTTNVGKVATPSDIEQLTETLTTSTQRHDLFSVDSVDLLQNFSIVEKTVAERVKKVGVDSDADIFNRALIETPNVVFGTGTSGTSISKNDIQRARTLLSMADCDMDGIRFYVDPMHMGEFVDNTSTLFNPTQSIAEAYIKGYTGRAVGAEWFEYNRASNLRVGFDSSSNVVADIVGAMASAVTVQGSTALSVSGFGANLRVQAGTILTIAGCNRVKPSTGEDTGMLAQFVVKTTVDLSGAGAGTLIVDPIYSTGGYKNTTALPANTAVVTILGTAGKIYRQSLMFHPDSYIVGFGKLPDTGDAGTFCGFERIEGMSLRMQRQHSIRNDSTDTRFDVLYGMTGNVREWSCKVLTPIN